MPHQRKPEFASWLGNGKEKTQAKCKLCHEVVELSNMYIQVLNIHQKGRKHISVVSSMSCFFFVFFSNLLSKVHQFHLKRPLQNLMTVPHQSSKPWKSAY